MEYEITCKFIVSELEDAGAAEEFGMSLCEHVLDTFNDNETIAPMYGVQVKRERRK